LGRVAGAKSAGSPAKQAADSLVDLRLCARIERAMCASALQLRFRRDRDRRSHAVCA